MVYNVNDFKKVEHFYFCLLVSMKIEMKINKDVSQAEMRKFICQWLKNAKDRKVFDNLLLNDILLIENEMAQQPFSFIYSQISRINKILSNSPHSLINAISDVKDSGKSNAHHL